MHAQLPDLWSLVLDRQYVDPEALAVALEEQAVQSPLDFRTRLLIRDSANALQRYWGQERFSVWMNGSSACQAIEAICREDLGKPGFPFLGKQLKELTPAPLPQQDKELPPLA